MKGGITPGDMPGFPITISTGTFASEPMSFRLTGPLFNSTSGNIIEITSPHVTIDLNGFAITCLLSSCSGAAISSTNDNITVVNGTIRGYAQGVSLAGGGSRVEHVRAIGNGTGLVLGNDCTVRDTTANNNSGEGIKVGNGCTVANNVASSNGTDGIGTLQACNVTGNTVRANGGFGLDLAPSTGYSGNAVSGVSTVHLGVQTGTNLCNTTTTCP